MTEYPACHSFTTLSALDDEDGGGLRLVLRGVDGGMECLSHCDSESRIKHSGHLKFSSQSNVGVSITFEFVVLQPNPWYGGLRGTLVVGIYNAHAICIIFEHRLRCAGPVA